MWFSFHQSPFRKIVRVRVQFFHVAGVMTLNPVNLSGGQSVYCFNEHQIAVARELVLDRPATAPRLKAELERLEASYSRNERAALAFVLIDRLRQSTGPDENTS